MNRPFPNYRSYLIRFWRMDNAGQPVWRAGVQEPGSEQQLYFEHFADLCAFLATQLGIGEAEITASNEPASRE
jgi:hypothetical protein